MSVHRIPIATPSSSWPRLAACALALALCAGCNQDLSAPDSHATAEVALTGNGAPSGEHYTLNLIGSDKAKKFSARGSNRHTIFVWLYGETRIDLDEGPEFRVIDGNGTDGSAAFELPDPDPDNDGVTAYSVYARAHGKPGGSATITSCYTDAEGEWCSTEQVVLVRSGGNGPFTDVTQPLLTVCRDTDDDPGCDEREFLFDDANHDYWWKYDNDGLRVAQLRFYPVANDVGLDP